MHHFLDIEFYAQERQFLILKYSLTLSNSVEYGVGLSLLFAKNMQRTVILTYFDFI